MLTGEAIGAAAAIIWRHWVESTRIQELPEHCRPRDRESGYAIQRALVALSGQSVVGWKIAATSIVGQRHIGVDGPLAGSLLSSRVLADGASISLRGNYMRVGEAEFGFRVGRSLPRRERPYEVGEVLDAVESMHPTIEIPDTRYGDFARVGAPQLIADDACASWLVVGAAAPADWRTRDLVQHEVIAYIDGKPAATGTGANVLGDPRLALTWLVNELCVHGDGLAAGYLVTTGTCITPVPIAPGHELRADFGALGSLRANLQQ